MTDFRIANEFAAVDITRRDMPWGVALQIVDARTGVSIELDALEVEALTTLSKSDREALVNRSAGSLQRVRLQLSNDEYEDDYGDVRDAQ